MYREDNTRIQILKWLSPSYEIAHMIVSKAGKDLYRLTFAIAPTDYSESRSNNVQLSKTNAGWFGQPVGPSPITVNFSGYMLDVEGYLEKHQFLDNWGRFLQANRTSKMEYRNDYQVRFIIDGRAYYGYMQTITFQKSSQKPFTHQYSGTFIALYDKFIYKPDQLKVTTALGTYAVSTKVTKLGQSVYAILTR
jgi:hypothetical protein